MNDGMPNALSVIGTAARIETAWGRVTPSVRIMASIAVVASATPVAWLTPAGRAAGWWGVCGALLALAALVDVHERRLPDELLSFALVASLAPM